VSASPILVVPLDLQVKEYAAQSTMIYIWIIAVCVQLAVLIILEVLQHTSIAEGLLQTTPV
jgi:hypothetical protein